MRIAICDDENALRARLRKAIDSCGELPRRSKVEEFADGLALLDSHFADPFDIIFLDIQMEGKSGLEVGQEIRSHDKAAIIILVTSHKHYVFQSFKIEAFDYIVKPFDDETVADVLGRAIEKHIAQHHVVHYMWQGSSYSLNVCEVIYLEGYDRLITFFTEIDKYYCYGKLNEYEDQLAPYGFLRCHQGFLVNMNHIRIIRNTDILTVSGHTIQMSTRRRQGCLKAFSDFLVKYRV